jgi:hypothetical protein
LVISFEGKIAVLLLKPENFGLLNFSFSNENEFVDKKNIKKI